MPNDEPSSYPTPSQRCAQTRLAEGSIAAVDMCRCGVLQLHFCAVTLRMDHATLSELLAVLGHAVAEYAARSRRAEGDPSDPRYVVNGRGEA